MVSSSCVLYCRFQRSTFLMGGGNFRIELSRSNIFLFYERGAAEQL